VFLIPAGLYVLFAFVVPVIYNLILSFEVTTPATIASLFAPWAGLSNYKVTLLNSITQSALIRTLTFTVLSLLFQFLIGFGLALLFNLRFPLNKLARSLVIVPVAAAVPGHRLHLPVPVPARGRRGQPGPGSTCT
jgi:multiple sugar transport system permease protein